LVGISVQLELLLAGIDFEVVFIAPNGLDELAVGPDLRLDAVEVAPSDAVHPRNDAAFEQFDLGGDVDTEVKFE
jgi:hypothetical protein